MKKILWLIVGLIVLLIAVICIKTVLYTSKQIHVQPVAAADVDKQAVVSRFSKAIQIPTISTQDRSEFEPEPFTRFHDFLAQSFPHIHRVLERRVVNNYSLLFKWQGKNPDLKPMAFLAHMDVVPIEPGTEGKWGHGPFSGQIADNFVWGRGTLDMKGTLMSIAEAVEYLVKSGFTPERTVYLAFGHDEEIGGINGAGKIAAFLKESGVQLAFTLDEGMLILNTKLSPSKKPLAVIGLAEKGYVTLNLTAKGKGGHSSMPPAHTTLGALSRAVLRLEENQMPASLSGAAGALFEYIGPDLPLVQKILFANRWIFEGLILGQLQKIKTTNAMIRTTTAPTIMKGGVKENVLPSRAEALVNFRILPGDSVNKVVEHARKVIDDPVVEVSIHGREGRDPSPVSEVDSDGFSAIQNTVYQIFQGTSVAPGLVIAGTDSKHFTGIADNNYRFAPMVLGPEDTARFHGTNERMSIDNYVQAIQYYVQFIKNAAGKQ